MNMNSLDIYKMHILTFCHSRISLSKLYVPSQSGIKRNRLFVVEYDDKFDHEIGCDYRNSDRDLHIYAASSFDQNPINNF